ncbi:hypothetical protein K501DRAFT_330071 [Backusella circina FSU 941]|nr:hypothetical protein K501DRAFT_330071 [Backusella circina FSU 941]
MTNRTDLMNRIATASQEKIYPTIQSKTEIPLRKILLSSRLWNQVRLEQQQEEEQIEQKQALSDEDWWIAAAAAASDETLNSFVFNSQPLSDSESACLLDATTNLFLTSQPLTTSSPDWSWLEQETASTGDDKSDLSLLSHDEPSPLLSTTTTTTNTNHFSITQEDEEEEDWLTTLKSRKRQRESADDVQDFPSKKVLTNEAIDLITAAALLTSSVHRSPSCPPSPPSGPLLRV